MNKRQFLNKLDKLISPSHEEYIQLNARRAVDFYLVGNCLPLLHPVFKNIVQVIRFTYRYVPLIVIPLLAYSRADWLLLFGIPAAYLGSFAARHDFYIIPVLYLVFCIWVWVDRGFSQSYHVNLPLVCMIAGFIFRRQVRNIIDREVGRLIVVNENIYNILLEGKQLLIFRKS